MDDRRAVDGRVSNLREAPREIDCSAGVGRQPMKRRGTCPDAMELSAAESAASAEFESSTILGRRRERATEYGWRSSRGRSTSL